MRLRLCREERWRHLAVALPCHRGRDAPRGRGRCAARGEPQLRERGGWWSGLWNQNRPLLVGLGNRAFGFLPLPSAATAQGAPGGGSLCWGERAEGAGKQRLRWGGCAYEWVCGGVCGVDMYF